MKKCSKLPSSMVPFGPLSAPLPALLPTACFMPPSCSTTPYLLLCLRYAPLPALCPPACSPACSITDCLLLCMLYDTSLFPCLLLCLLYAPLLAIFPLSALLPTACSTQACLHYSPLPTPPCLLYSSLPALFLPAIGGHRYFKALKR